MNRPQNHSPTPPTDPPEGSDVIPVRLEWVDVDRRNWQIELAPERIRLCEGADCIDLPRHSWTRDIYIAPHGGSYIVRIDTFESAVRFMLPAKQAAPLLDHLSAGQPPKSTASQVTDHEAPVQESLLWPKVSPLAVGALMCSTLVFVPLLGVLPAVATVSLLILHRRNVSRAVAWRHSRATCTAAFIFLIAGLGVSALATWCMAKPPTAIHAGVTAAPAGTTQGINWGVVAAGIFVVLLSLTVHEAAHAVTAWWLGDGLARSLGRVTLNPLAHIDPFGTLVLPLILVWVGGPVFGYARPVPVRVESLPRHRRAHILISLAGPASNLVLAAGSLMLLLALGCLIQLAAPHASVSGFSDWGFRAPVTASGFPLAGLFGPLCTILRLSFIINTVLAVFNLIPIPPLDGSWVLEHLFPSSLGPLYAKIRPYGFLVFVGAISLGLFQYLMRPVWWILEPGFALLSHATGLS